MLRYTYIACLMSVQFVLFILGTLYSRVCIVSLNVGAVFIKRYFDNDNSSSLKRPEVKHGRSWDKLKLCVMISCGM
jgi:hypothetical protein